MHLKGGDLVIDGFVRIWSCPANDLSYRVQPIPGFSWELIDIPVYAPVSYTHFCLGRVYFVVLVPMDVSASSTGSHNSILFPSSSMI